MTRMEIEEKLPKKRNLSKTTILSFLSRLEEKGFVRIEKRAEITATHRWWKKKIIWTVCRRENLWAIYF